MLSDEFGFRREANRWIIGGIDFPMEPVDFIPHTHPDNVEVTMAPKGADLGQMLESGDIDALISADLPKCVLDQSPNVGPAVRGLRDGSNGTITDAPASFPSCTPSSSPVNWPSGSRMW